MAESITEGTLKQWLKQEGDYVEADEEVATIETDKVSFRFSQAAALRRHAGEESDRGSPFIPSDLLTLAAAR